MYPIIKRLIDIIIALTALIILSPLFIIVIPLLLLSGEHQVFFGQPRVGYKKTVFMLLKFVTMLKNSPNTGTGTITTKNDPRVLPVGRFLRKAKINELPQILNVLKGDMTIVGPRPQTQECFEYYNNNVQDTIYNSVPGLTGVGSIIYRDEEDIMAKSKKSLADCYKEDIMPIKGRAELWYHENKSLFLDFKLIVLTALVVLFPSSTLPSKWLPKFD